MDYEKMYKEALEKARKKYNAKYHPDMGPGGVYLNNADLEEIFPQLKESEDERIRGCIGVILTDQTEQRFTDYGVSLKDCLAFLDWQKEQKEQKPAEWSEEDEDTYNQVYYLFRDARDEWYKAIFSGCYPKITRDKVLAMLKSLHSCPKASDNWKPSKEQMKAFKMYIQEFQARAEAAVGGWNNFDVMVRLYEQLKKLDEIEIL